MAAVIKVVVLFCLLIVALTTYLSMNQRKFLYHPDQQPLDGDFRGKQVATTPPNPQPVQPIGGVVGVEGMSQQQPSPENSSTIKMQPVGAEAVLQSRPMLKADIIQPQSEPIEREPEQPVVKQTVVEQQVVENIEPAAPAPIPAATPVFTKEQSVAEINAQIAAQNAATRALELELAEAEQEQQSSDLLSLDDLMNKRQPVLPDPVVDSGNEPPLPPPLKPTDLGPKFEVVSVVTDDGLELQALYAVPAAADDKVILYFHGNGGNANHRLDKARELYAEGYGVYLAEYRGYAGNPGQVSERGLKLDALAHLAYAITSIGSASQVILYGESLGTGLAIYAASEAATYGEEPVHAVVLEAPYSSILDVANKKFWWVPGKKYLLQDTYDSTEHVDSIKAPLLILHGKQDKTIPVALAEKLYAAATNPKKLVLKDKAGHNDLYAHGALADITEFLTTLK